MIDDIINEICAVEREKSQKKAVSGRKNRGISKKHNDMHNDFQKVLRNESQLSNVDSDTLEPCVDPKKFQLEINNIFRRTLAEFKADNKELTEKYPYLWYKQFLIELKKNTPKVSIEDIDLLYILWDELTLLMNSIGLYITVETFYLFTGTYKYQFEKKADVTPRYAAFLKKIYNERDLAMENELAYNPYNQTNKIYLHKLHGYVEEGKTQHIEVSHSIREFDNLPMFSNNENN